MSQMSVYCLGLQTAQLPNIDCKFLTFQRLKPFTFINSLLIHTQKYTILISITFLSNFIFSKFRSAVSHQSRLAVATDNVILPNCYDVLCF